MHILTAFILIFSSLAIAKTRPPIKNRSGIDIEYRQRLWNSDSKQIDTGYVVIKDSKSEKLVVLQLQESEPDSSVFTGSYNIELGKSQKYVPAIYIPDENELKSGDEKQKFLQNIKEGKVSRKPFILKSEGARQILETFDNKKAAISALKSYRRHRALAKSEKVLKDGEYTEDMQLENASDLALVNKLSGLTKEAVSREKERTRMLQEEKRKLAELKKNYDALSEAQKAESKKTAAEHLKTGFALFEAGNFIEAESEFLIALEKDPYSSKSLYTYAVNLFRVEKYNRALTIFRMVDDSDREIDKTEKLYYLASCHYKLVEFDYASELFGRVKNSANKNLSGSSSFYLGLIQYQKENFNAAKVEFEFVLDNSIDPELDKQAEMYIERIQHDLQFIESKKKPYYANLSAGITQDSNILLQPDGTSASATAADDGGLRFQMAGSLEYKAKQTRVDEWSVKTTLVYLYSVDDEFTQADPLDIIVSAPYKRNSQAFGKSYRWEVEPGVESLFMDVDQEGSRENILNAGFVNWKNSIVMSDKLISNYNFQLYYNDSKIDATTSDEDATGLKYTFTYNNIYFLNREKGKIIISDVGVSMNDADGKNYSYLRFDLAINYIQPITLWDLTVSTKLAYNQSSYDSTDDREDKNTSLNITFIRSINDWLGCNASLGYIDNKSNVSTREYDKYTIGANLTGKWNF